MADNKKYYYLKLKDNFYDSEQLIILQNMPDGYLYSDILMKLYLRSLKTEGKLMFNNLIPYTPTILAQVVRHQVGTVEKALDIFQQLGLIEILENGTIYMLDIQNFIGKSSTEADRQRKYYNKIKGDNDTCKISCKISTPEIEIEKEIEKELEIDIEKEKQEKENIYEFIEKNFCRTLSPIEVEVIDSWKDNDLTRYAIKQAVLNGAYNIKYIDKILYNYQKNNITSVQQAQEKDRKFRDRNIEEPSEWFNQDLENEELTEEEKEEMDNELDNLINKISSM
jgi:predicted phage replisome organizer